MRSVLISSLLPADSPRLGGLDEDHVRRLTEIDSALPPILVHRHTSRVIDGMHRLSAAKLRGRVEIQAEFFNGTEEEAFLRGVETNTTHGLPLSSADRRAAAIRIITYWPQLADRIIAERTGLSAKSVATLRKRSTGDAPQTNARIGTDGRVRPLSGSAGRLLAAEIIAARPTASLREIARDAGISVGTAHDVRLRIRRGQSPLPPRLRGPEPDGGTGPDPTPAPARRGRRSTANAAASTESSRDSFVILQTLMKDPSLRQTNAGRELLRWLTTRVVTTADDWPVPIEAIPPHCAGVIVELASHCAKAWDQLALKLRQRRDADV